MFFRFKNGNNCSFSDKFIQTDETASNMSQYEGIDNEDTHKGLFVYFFTG